MTMSNNLDNFVKNIRTLSTSGNYEDLAVLLLNGNELLQKNWNALDAISETLNTEQHTLPMLYILCTKFRYATKLNLEVNTMLTLFEDFLKDSVSCQLRLASNIFYDLCHTLTNKLIMQTNCMKGIKVLAEAIEKIRISESQLMPIHADLCQLSLKAKWFKYALKYLDVDITIISTSWDSSLNHSKLSSRDGNYRKKFDLQDFNDDARYFLLYYYYGGMIYTAMKNFERALYFYEVCISTPALAVSSIMVEAYKKFILVSLILHEEVLPLPKYATQTVTRLIKPMAHVYHTLAMAYASGSNRDVVAVINKFREVFQRDKNLGLVKQVAYSLNKKNIKQLTKIFMTLSLPDVASRTHLPNAKIAEKYVLRMIQFGEIHASIDQKNNMVIFHDDPEQFNSKEMFMRLQSNMSAVANLVEKIRHMEEEIMSNPTFVKKAFNSMDDDSSANISKAYSYMN